MHPSRCLPSRPAVRPPYLDLSLEKLVLANSRRLCVKFSTFREKVNIYSYVSGDSDNHPCMMQSTIRDELTRLFRTNSSVDSFEQEVKFFRVKWTWRGNDDRDVDQIAMCCPYLAKKTPVGGPNRVKRRLFVNKVQLFRGLRHFPSRRVMNKHVKVVQTFLDRECKPIVTRTVSPNLSRRTYSVARPYGRQTRQG